MKIPRDISGERLLSVLIDLGYVIKNRKGSHLRLKITTSQGEHGITIPMHTSIKIGTLYSIIKDISENTNLTKEEIINLI